jgi:endogenous inhibitor of DNA gyrase (YacG/DUF329 family)
MNSSRSAQPVLAEVGCEVCPRRVVVAGGTAVLVGSARTACVCSDDCYRELRNRRRRVTHAQIPCASCESPFTPKKEGRRFCSDRCRVNWHRAEKRAAREIRQRETDAAFREQLRRKLRDSAAERKSPT